MTRTEVQTAADTFLKALDAAPTGSGTVLKDQGSKDWMETSVLRALAKLDAAAYHCSGVSGTLIIIRTHLTKGGEDRPAA